MNVINAGDIKHATYSLDYSEPMLFLAIHNGHNLSENIKDKIFITDADRLREEDPYTERFVNDKCNYIIQNTSRFECDLNRNRDKAVYKRPEDCWGLPIYNGEKRLNEQEINNSLTIYDNFYIELVKIVDNFLKKFNKIVIWDVHSYNHRRQGINAHYDCLEGNPEIIIGTTNYNFMSIKWKELIDCIETYMKSQPLNKRQYKNRPLNLPNLDVRQNVKFSGGNLSQFLNNKYGERVCCIAIEFKKIWMNEWTGEVDEDCFKNLKNIFDSTCEGIKFST